MVKKVLLGKEKVLGTSIFSFSHNIFKSLLFLGGVKMWDCVVNSLPNKMKILGYIER